MAPGLTGKITREEKVSWVGLGVNGLLVMIKYGAGFLGHSAAMVADATHSMSDLLTDVLAVVGFRISAKPSDSCHAYGHGRAETLLEGLCGISLMGAGLFILHGGIVGIWEALKGTASAPEGFVVPVALCSVVVKEWLYRYTDRWAARLGSFALRAKALDHRSDALSSVGTLVGIGGAWFLGGRFAVLDSLAAAAVSFFIIRASIPIMGRSLGELMEGALPEEELKRISRALAGTQGVMGHHHVRTRRVGPTSAVEAHVLVDPDMPLWAAHAIATEAERAIKRELGERTLVTIHVEPWGGDVDEEQGLS
ncbi:cation diffusion facilitator family transporter [Thermanaerovibrio velox DSM 12556]|uniref:Cation diffusion facilitator family transporter n=1 Tax=Thermanaerovibrio velox DSM 12556 TaxID=926567 RepID=H0UR74_9BACT|nr:cation diffusion facilitator family transporter [Thermanaerovibrio velox]EHM10911.1 cation diffusion facilitator family transporter [Thermanaerovibrio velox DSM 12556]